MPQQLIMIPALRAPACDATAMTTSASTRPGDCGMRGNEPWRHTHGCGDAAWITNQIAVSLCSAFPQTEGSGGSAPKARARRPSSAQSEAARRRLLRPRSAGVGRSERLDVTSSRPTMPLSCASSQAHPSRQASCRKDRSASPSPARFNNRGTGLEQYLSSLDCDSMSNIKEASCQPGASLICDKGKLESIEFSLRSRRLAKQDMIAAMLMRSSKDRLCGSRKLYTFDGPDEHIHQALCRRAASFVENRLSGSSLWNFKWTVNDCESDYKNLEDGDLYNHFQNNRELTTKVGLMRSLHGLAAESGVDIDAFFPRCYDLSVTSEWQDFVLDYRRCAALKVVLQHQRLAAGALALDHRCTDYTYNVDVLRTASCALKQWLQDLNGAFLEEEADPRVSISRKEWDALVTYSELTDAELCRTEDAHGSEQRRARNRGFSSSGGAIEQDWNSRPRATQRPTDVRSWLEFCDHYWVAAVPSPLQEKLDKALEALAFHWPQMRIHGCMNTWIVKPGTSSKGSGVACMQSLPEVLHHCKTVTNRIVQKYVERPLLLFGGRKFDIRQWVLVRSFEPLRAYMFSSCYLRLCNEPFDLCDLNNRQRHISNWTVNKKGKHPVEGSVASLSELQQALAEITGDGDYWDKELQPKIKDIVLHSLRSVQKRIIQRASSFEVYGFDLAISEDLQPWLLEVNLSPACEARTPWMSLMLDRMATRLLDLLLDGELKDDGQQPDWICICNDHSVVGSPRGTRGSTMQNSMAHGASIDPIAIVEPPTGCIGLTVVGKAINIRSFRRFDEAWRRCDAQKVLNRALRRYLLRLRARRYHRENSAILIQRATRRRLFRSHLWQRIANRRRLLAILCLQNRCRQFYASSMLRRTTWTCHAITMQRRWRGVLGRQRARMKLMLRAAIRISSHIRGWIVRRTLRARRRILQWWRRAFSHRNSSARSIQAFWRGQYCRRSYHQLREHIYRPARILAILIGLGLWRRQTSLCVRHSFACKLQSVWRGRKCRKSVVQRRFCLELIRAWRASSSTTAREAIKIQSHWRSRCVLRFVRLKKMAIHKIQCAWRIFMARRRTWNLRLTKAATRIERWTRAMRARSIYACARRSVVAIQMAWRSYLFRMHVKRRCRLRERRRRWITLAEESHPSSASLVPNTAGCNRPCCIEGDRKVNFRPRVRDYGTESQSFLSAFERDSWEIDKSTWEKPEESLCSISTDDKHCGLTEDDDENADEHEYEDDFEYYDDGGFVEEHEDMKSSSTHQSFERSEHQDDQDFALHASRNLAAGQCLTDEYVFRPNPACVVSKSPMSTIAPSDSGHKDFSAYRKSFSNESDFVGGMKNRDDIGLGRDIARCDERKNSYSVGDLHGAKGAAHIGVRGGSAFHVARQLRSYRNAASGIASVTPLLAADTALESAARAAAAISSQCPKHSGSEPLLETHVASVHGHTSLASSKYAAASLESLHSASCRSSLASFSRTDKYEDLVLSGTLLNIQTSSSSSTSTAPTANSSQRVSSSAEAAYIPARHLLRSRSAFSWGRSK